MFKNSSPMKRFFLLLLILCSTQIFAQNHKNYVTPHFSISHMKSSHQWVGNSDQWGYSFGLNYTRVLYGNFGLSTGYNRSIFKPNAEVDNVIEYKFDSYNIGLAYGIGSSHHRLAASAGFNYKYINTYGYIGFCGTPPRAKEEVTAHQYGLYVNLDYTYYFTDSFGIGAHTAIEPSGHKLSMVGINCSARF